MNVSAENCTMYGLVLISSICTFAKLELIEYEGAVTWQIEANDLLGTVIPRFTQAQ